MRGHRQCRRAMLDDERIMRSPAEPPQLKKVRTLWLPVSDVEKYLLLEDEETGDVLLPLIYMKSVFEANYSRKLSSLKHRLIVLPSTDNCSGESPGQKRKGYLDGESSHAFVYWQWAFESPHEVKVLVRQALGEENTPQGHLRLVLLPIVYNAMAQKPKLRAAPFFRTLHRALHASNYAELLKLPPNVELELADETKASLALSLGNSNGKGGQRKSGRVFNGPVDLQRTLAKYTLTYEAAEDSDIGKRRAASSGNIPSALRSAHSLPSHMSSSAAAQQRCLTSPGGLQECERDSLMVLQQQNEQISCEVKALRKDFEDNMKGIYMEIFTVRRVMQEILHKFLPFEANLLQQSQNYQDAPH
eukprot:SM000048S16562  [mRNA]  locus=s48:418303:421271:- [translate_table: standard]